MGCSLHLLQHGRSTQVQARRTTTDDVAGSVAMSPMTENEKHPATSSAEGPRTSNGDAEAPAAELPTEDAQRGVQNVEAITLTWSKKALVAIFINMWLLYFVNAFQSSILYNLVPFATSDFETHSLLTVIYIVANAMSAAVYIPLAKMLDLWGRAEGFLLMIAFATLGLILMASCNSLSTFCAAQVFYSIGFGGMTYSIDVITADASKLKNRGLAYAFTSSPYMITAFAGAKASEDFYYNISWRWGFGCFAIILPFVAAPLYLNLKYHLRKAEKQGLLKRAKSGRTLTQNIWHYTQEFDAAGVFLFASGLTVFLLPFTLADSAPNGWSTGYIIAMIVVGFVVLGLFGLYEAFVARTPFLSVNLLANRTVIGACLLDFTYQVSYYRWLHFVAVPLYLFAQGLMIYFRRPNQKIGYIVMCQIFISIGGAIFIIVQQISILAAADHQHVAAVLALLYVVGNVGGAVGNTISGAIWTNTFEKALERYLPADAQSSIEDIYNSLDVQLSYPVGSPERLGIQEAYGYAQARMLAVGTGLMGLSLIWMFMIRNINLKKVDQVKGTIF